MDLSEVTVRSALIIHSSLAFRGGWIPRPPAKSENPQIFEGPSPQIMFLCFFILFFPFQTHCGGSCFLFPLNSLNIIRYGSQNCSCCRKILMLPSIKGPGDVFSFLGQPREFAKLRMN